MWAEPVYSLKYGTVPVVHATGGLADTIVNLTDETLADGTANGFSFDAYTTAALADALERACRTFTNRPMWEQLVRTGMRQDWSWNHRPGSTAASTSTHWRTGPRRRPAASIACTMPESPYRLADRSHGVRRRKSCRAPESNSARRCRACRRPIRGHARSAPDRSTVRRRQCTKFSMNSGDGKFASCPTSIRPSWKVPLRQARLRARRRPRSAFMK